MGGEKPNGPSHPWTDLLYYTYLLLAKCEVRTASYGASFNFFLPSICFMAQAPTKGAGHEHKAGKKRGSIACRTDRANEANKTFII